MRNYILLTSIALILILSGCSASANSETGPFPATEIISKEPVVIGYIVEVLEEDQVIFVKSDVTKEEAMKTNRNDTGNNMHMFFSNATTFDGELEKGYKVAVWEFADKEAKDNSISERIVILEK
ncbi:hypothetical protein [Metaplanococcus flavidus]|uniref:DUF3221 domain-containing protein n=1 Tax=Metaplanococcus flavidus TaxID=569883 RepID=A0ABW3LFE7_9BACL